MLKPGGRCLGIFVINLDRSPERWTKIAANFGGLSWPLIRVRGLDARAEADAILAVRDLKLAMPPYALGWSPHRGQTYFLTEEACFVGHLRALSSFLETDLDLALILEDDAVPRPGLTDALSDLVASGLDFELIKLEGLRKSSTHRWAYDVARIGGVSLVRSFRKSFGSAAYIVTRESAAKLIANSGRMMVSYDVFLSNPGLTGCDTWNSSPWLIDQSGDETTLSFHGPKPTYERRSGPISYLHQLHVQLSLRVRLWHMIWIKSAGMARGWPRRAPWW